MASIHPEPRVEKLKASGREESRLEVTLPENTVQTLRRAQDIIASKKKAHVNIAETIAIALEFYLEKTDPVRKAGRAGKYVKAPTVHGEQFQAQTNAQVQMQSQSQSNVKNKNNQRNKIPAQLRHAVYSRDQGQCTHINPNTNKRCETRRWLDFHHRIPIAQGGFDTLENLITLCSNHHRIYHHVATSAKNKIGTNLSK